MNNSIIKSTYDDSDIKESVDIYSSNGDHIGIVNRGIAHDEGLLHYSIHCWVYGFYKGRKAIVFQKRNTHKRLFPGKYDVSVAGHYTAGEIGRDGLRELFEELHIEKYDFEVSYIKSVDIHYEDSVIINNEVANVYYCRIDSPIESLEVDHSELADLVIGNVDDVIQLFVGEVDKIAVMSLGSKNMISVELHDFVDSYKSYFLQCLFDIASFNMERIKRQKYYTFIMLKPDAVERGLVSDIMNLFVSKGFHIEYFDAIIPSDEMIYRHYENKINEEGDNYKIKASKYFHNKLVIPIIISHRAPSIIRYVRDIVGYKDPQLATKESIRGLWGIDSMALSDFENRCCENLIHASDSYDSFKRETTIWFRRREIERFFL